MTDLEMAQTAALYLSKLSNGMNPITGEDLPEDTVLNQIYLCRSFAFASKVMEEFVKNGCKFGGNSSSKPQSPFTISEGQRAKIVLSESAVSITAIANRIERVLDINVKPLSPAKITQWLEMQGLLKTIVEENGKRVRVATEEGDQIGIVTKEEVFRNETIKKSYYNLNAQAFIIANLMEIAQSDDLLLFESNKEKEDLNKKKKKTKKSN